MKRLNSTNNFFCERPGEACLADSAVVEPSFMLSGELDGTLGSCANADKSVSSSLALIFAATRSEAIVSISIYQISG